MYSSRYAPRTEILQTLPFSQRAFLCFVIVLHYGHILTVIIIIIIIVIVICYQLALDRPVSGSSNRLFKGPRSRLRPCGR